MEGLFTGLEICPGTKRGILKTKEIWEMQEFRTVLWFVVEKDTINADNLQEESGLLCSKQGRFVLESGGAHSSACVGLGFILS